MRALALATLLLTGCLGAPAGPEQPDALTHRFEGAASAEQVSDFAFDVPPGAAGVNATLSWDDPDARLALELLDPHGAIASRGRRDIDGRMVAVALDPPAEGAWTARVRGLAGEATPFRLEAAVERSLPDERVAREAVEIAPGRSVEFNVVLEKDAPLAVSFAAGAPLSWDLHSHPEGALRTWAEGEGATGNATLTAPARGVYSALWKNEQGAPVTVEFEARGRFRHHSLLG